MIAHLFVFSCEEEIVAPGDATYGIGSGEGSVRMTFVPGGIVGTGAAMALGVVNRVVPSRLVPHTCRNRIASPRSPCRSNRCR